MFHLLTSRRQHQYYTVCTGSNSIFLNLFSNKWMQYWLANPEEGCFFLCLLFTIKVMQKQASNRSKVPIANIYRASSKAKNSLWSKVQTTHCHLFQSNSALNKELQGQAERKIMSVRLKAKFGLKHAMDHTTWLFLYGKSWSSSQLLNSFSDENCRKIHN